MSDKPFLEIAPWLVVVFKRAFEYDADGTKHQNYYVNESVGIATGHAPFGCSSCWVGHPYAHAEPDEFLGCGVGASGERTTFPPDPHGTIRLRSVLVPSSKRKALEDVLVPYL
jgi:iodotyrosine deiodinase